MSKVVVESAGEEKVAEGEGPLFDLATEQDLPIPFGCTAARCGVCQVKVLEGELVVPMGFGPVRAAEMVGRPVAVVWPPGRWRGLSGSERD